MRFILIGGPGEYWRANAAIDGLAPEQELTLLIGKEGATSIARDGVGQFVVTGDPLPKTISEQVAQHRLSHVKLKPYRGAVKQGLAS